MSKKTTNDAPVDFVSKLRAIDVYPTEIAVRHGETYDPRSTNRSKTFSRFNWLNQQFSILIKESSDSTIQPSYLIRFRLNTVTTIGLGAALPSDVDIPADTILGTIAINFAIEYFTPIDPKLVNSDRMLEIEQSKVLDDVWPYWRESLQNLALRAKFPIPVLPLRYALLGETHPAPEHPPATKKRAIVKSSVQQASQATL